MEASYFYVLILPLGIFVFLMSSLAFYYARKEELARKKWTELTNLHIEEQPEHEETISNELKGLEKLLQSKAIDQTTYQQLKKALEDYYKMNAELDCSEEDTICSVT